MFYGMFWLSCWFQNLDTQHQPLRAFQMILHQTLLYKCKHNGFFFIFLVSFLVFGFSTWVEFYNKLFLDRTKLGNGLLSGDYSKSPVEGVDERLQVSGSVCMPSLDSFLIRCSFSLITYNAHVILTLGS